MADEDIRDGPRNSDRVSRDDDQAFQRLVFESFRPAKFARCKTVLRHVSGESVSSVEFLWGYG